jgi:hypothetical protein
LFDVAGLEAVVRGYLVHGLAVIDAVGNGLCRDAGAHTPSCDRLSVQRDQRFRERQ